MIQQTQRRGKKAFEAITDFSERISSF